MGKQYTPLYEGKKLKVKFKKQSFEANLAEAFAYSYVTIINVNNQQVGRIRYITRQAQEKAEWRVAFSCLKAKPQPNQLDWIPCWHWVYLETKFSTEKDARLHVKKYIHVIVNKYRLCEADY